MIRLIHKMSDKLKGHHILLYAGDFARLQSIYTNISPNYVIRELVRKHCEAVELKIRSTQDERNNPSRTVLKGSAKV